MCPEHSVWAFGSRVKGTTKPYSDLDLVIITNTPLNLQTHADLVDAFSESDLPWRVDLVDWSLTSEKFKQIILNLLRSHSVIYSLNQNFDLAHKIKKYLRKVLNNLI